jgi:hypothetical protein
MHMLIVLIWIAGFVQLAIVAANFVVPGKLRCGENLRRVSPMIRSVFFVHWGYILLILVIFSAICFGFSKELAGETALGRFLSAAIAIFWLLRIPIQLFVYDRDLRRQHRAGDVAMLVALGFLVIVFGAAAIGLSV